jgi:ABC-type sugar transport system permease subunit
MYIQAFTSGNMGYACAIGTAIFLIIALITLLTFKVMDKAQFNVDA